jgi:hypothetical protein
MKQIKYQAQRPLLDVFSRGSRLGLWLSWWCHHACYDELYKFKEQLHHVLVRHEQEEQRMLRKDLPETRKSGCRNRNFGSWRHESCYRYRRCANWFHQWCVLQDKWVNIYTGSFKKQILDFNTSYRSGITNHRGIEIPEIMAKAFYIIDQVVQVSINRHH